MYLHEVNWIFKLLQKMSDSQSIHPKLSIFCSGKNGHERVAKKTVVNFYYGFFLPCFGIVWDTASSSSNSDSNSSKDKEDREGLKNQDDKFWAVFTEEEC